MMHPSCVLFSARRQNKLGRWTLTDITPTYIAIPLSSESLKVISFNKLDILNSPLLTDSVRDEILNYKVKANNLNKSEGDIHVESARVAEGEIDEFRPVIPPVICYRFLQVLRGEHVVAWVSGRCRPCDMLITLLW